MLQWLLLHSTIVILRTEAYSLKSFFIVILMDTLIFFGLWEHL